MQDNGCSGYIVVFLIEVRIIEDALYSVVVDFTINCARVVMIIALTRLLSGELCE